MEEFSRTAGASAGTTQQDVEPERSMGWQVVLPGLPEGYEVLEQEDGLTLFDPTGKVVAVYGPMLSDLDEVVRAAWQHARPAGQGWLLPAL